MVVLEVVPQLILEVPVATATCLAVLSTCIWTLQLVVVAEPVAGTRRSAAFSSAYSSVTDCTTSLVSFPGDADEFGTPAAHGFTSGRLAWTETCAVLRLVAVTRGHAPAATAKACLTSSGMRWIWESPNWLGTSLWIKMPHWRRSGAAAGDRDG